jgi:hypothetical protein
MCIHGLFHTVYLKGIISIIGLLFFCNKLKLLIRTCRKEGRIPLLRYKIRVLHQIISYINNINISHFFTKFSVFFLRNRITIAFYRSLMLIQFFIFGIFGKTRIDLLLFFPYNQSVVSIFNFL